MKREDVLNEQLDPDQLLKTGNKLLEELESDANAPDFLRPVAWKKLGLKNYLDVIKKPMDLSTVKRNLKQEKYANLGQLARDLGLIWKNCMKYNEDFCEIWMRARRMEKLCEQLVSERVSKMLDAKKKERRLLELGSRKAVKRAKIEEVAVIHPAPQEVSASPTPPPTPPKPEITTVANIQSDIYAHHKLAWMDRHKAQFT